MSTSAKFNFNLSHKSFFLSLLFHLMIFLPFVFVFPARDIKPLPDFIFLGSIFSQQDMAVKEPARRSSHVSVKDAAISDDVFPAEKPINNFSLAKPAAVIPKQEKNDAKLTFDTRDIEKKLEEENNANQSAFTPGNIRYKPLTME